MRSKMSSVRRERRRRFSLVPVHSAAQDAVVNDDGTGDTDAPTDGSQNTRSYIIPPEQLERIKDSVDIVTVIESYDLPGFQRQGNNRAKALCPFHDDHNPSMSVDGRRGIYKCFACGAGGDVFNFVRKYNALKHEPMTFYQAVRHVAQEFGDASLKLDFLSSSSSQSRMTDEERKVLNERKRRLLLANAAAAAFYAKCLITMPEAGVARSHIQERGLLPTTAKAFAMGYAPDAYFRWKGHRAWGMGGLVHHLRDLGFKPSEITEAGLATRTKRSLQNVASVNNAVVNATSDRVEETDNDYDTLIDRFRNRLVVPIFDSRGSSVLGFGARILPPEETDDSGFKASKYLNSPESPVFQKKNILFGHHFAREAVQEMRKLDKSNGAGPDRGSVVIVEGYMDAISLWEAGIQVVASMGTALTVEQLSSAARIAGSPGGRIVLCFDNDEAGSNAVERLCTGPLLARTAETYVVEIVVATLPTNCKDPGEYIESKSSMNKARAGDEFRKGVLDAAMDWTAWYLQKLLSRYDERALRGTAGSFADICDRVSEFLSRFPNPAERTKRAHDVAGSLADIVASGESSNALRIQLETDLVNMVARKAEMKESLERRIESVDGYAEDRNRQKLAKMTRGDGVSSPDETLKLSTSAIKSSKEGKAIDAKRGVPERRSTNEDLGFANGRRRRARLKRASKKLVHPSLTPHFSGFDFEYPSDLDWLNLPREKWKRKKIDLTLGTDMNCRARAKAGQTGEEDVPSLRVDNLVYFNSNEYHGEQFVTEEALDAGYSNVEVARDPSIFERGVGTLVRQDALALVDAAEVKLLKNVVRFRRARLAMIHSLETNDATDSRNRIEWSRPERAWLFDRLVKESNLIPKEILNECSMQDLQEYLAGLPDAPVGAFSVHSESFNATENVHAINRSHCNGGLQYLDGSAEPEGRVKISTAVADSDFDIGSSTDETSVPSDFDDIESWAASYDPSMFDDAMPAIPVETGQQGTCPPVMAEAAHQEIETGVSNSYSTETPGCLDMFFAVEEDLFATTYDDSVSRELRAELEVQEAHATLLVATALKQLAVVKEEWLAVGRVLSSRLDVLDSAISDGVEYSSESILDLDSMSVDALKEYSTTLTATLRDITETVCRLHVSAKRTGSRLMDYSNADGIEGQLSVAQQEWLASMVDDHVKSLPEDWKAPELAEVNNMNRSHNNCDPMFGWGDDNSLDRVVSFEDDMAQIDQDWGEWADDDFVWSPEDDLDSFKLSTHGTSANVPNVLDVLEIEEREEEAESLEEALQRLDSEWSHWENIDPEGTSSVNDSQGPEDSYLADVSGVDEVESHDSDATLNSTVDCRTGALPDYDSFFE